METEYLLFIGGHSDGKRMVIRDDMESIELPVKQAALERIIRERYVRKSFRGNSTRFDIFALDGITADEIFKRLIERY